MACPQPGEPGRVAGPLKVPGQRPRADAGGGQPAQARAHDVGADHEDQPDWTARPSAGRRARRGRPASRRSPASSPAPASSAPLASHRCCQVPPGWSGKPGQAPGPRRGPASCGCPGVGTVNGGRVIKPSTGSRPRWVAGQSAGPGGREPGARRCPRRLAGLTPQLHRRRHLAGGLASCSRTVTMPRSRTARSSVSGRYPAAGTARPAAAACRSVSP